MTTTGGRLGRWVTGLGAANTGFLLVYSALSYALVAHVPFGNQKPPDSHVLGWLVGAVASLGPGIEALVRNDSVFAEPRIWLLAYATPLVCGAAIFATLLALVARAQDEIPESLPRQIFAWGVAFAVLCVVAVPIQSPDFWYHLYWGNVVVAGENPYYHDPAQSSFSQGLPTGESPISFVYGPLWALLVGGVALLGGGSPLAMAILFKLLQAVVWIASFWLVKSSLEDRSRRSQCLGLLVFGWIPLGVIEVVAEGHNDGYLILGLSAWLYLSRRPPAVATSVALAISVLFKYVTAPLFLLDFLRHWRGAARPILSYAPTALTVAGVAGAAFAVYLRSLDYFSAVLSMRSWYFGTPERAVKAVELFSGIDLWRTNEAVEVLFPVLAVVAVWRYARRPSESGLVQAALALLAGVLFSSSHVWPWYVVWLLAPAALAPNGALARFSVGVALVVWWPVAVTNTFKYQGLDGWPLPTLVVYLFAVVWMLATRRLLPKRVG